VTSRIAVQVAVGITDDDDVTAILHKMRTHTASGMLQAQACEALDVLISVADKTAADSIALASDHAATILTAGGVEVVVAAMRAHAMERSEVGLRGCNVLGALAFHHPNQKAQMGEAGGVAVVVAAMRAHPHVYAVQHAGVSALHALVCTADPAGFCFANKAVFDEENAAAVIRAAVTAFFGVCLLCLALCLGIFCFVLFEFSKCSS
jgi:hypothetical protein